MDKLNIPPRVNTDAEDLSSPVRAAFVAGYVASRLFRDTKEFIAAQEKFHEETEKALYVFLHQPVIAAFGAWVKSRQTLDPKIADRAEKLLGIWGLPNKNKDTFVTLLELRSLNHEKTINKIRNSREKSAEIREYLVSTYISFINWLSEITLNYINPLIDPDYQKRQGRVVDYIIFIKLLDCLDEKSQLVAKLLYFGGSRLLEEVLDLEIGDVDFNKSLVTYRNQLVQYPQHITEDIKLLMGNRKSGRVFLGRQDAPLNPSTIFRNFKEAGSQVGLGNSFSAKMLTISK